MGFLVVACSEWPRMTNQIAHIVILVFPAAIILVIAAVGRIGRARRRKPGQTALPPGANAVRFADSVRLDMVNSVVDLIGNRP